MTKEIFSVYKPPLSSATIPVASQDLGSIWEGITDHTLKDQTDRLRSLLSQSNREEYKKQKGLLLPSATFGGVFDYRHEKPEEYRVSLNRSLENETDPNKIAKTKEKINLLQGKKGLLSASGLVVIDIDHISETGQTLQELREALYTDTEIGVRLIFVSPSGDGLKVICRTSAEITDPQSYRAVFDSLRYYINTTYGEIVDKSGSDITRLCLLCYDPDAKIADSEDFFNPDLHPVPKKIQKPKNTYQETDSFCNSGEDGIEEIVRRVEESGVDFGGYDEYLKLGYFFANCIGGNSGLDMYRRICRGHINRDGGLITDEEIETQFEKCKGGNSYPGVFIDLCKSKGINVNDYNNKRGGLPYIPNMTHNRENYSTPETAPKPEKTPEEKYRDFLSIPPLSEVAKKKREGIKTGYKFEKIKKGKKKEDYLTLRSGAMTLICGKSSHCKSKLLQNIALQISEDIYNKQEEGSVLFFTYEEELSDVLLQFANIYANIEELSRYDTENTEVIQDFLTTGDSSRCTRDKKNSLQKKLSSFKTLYETGTLRVFYTDKDSQSLCELIQYLSSQIKVKAVFVDYVQLLYRDYSQKGQRRPERREELKEICNDLRKTAIDLGLPIVLSAQLNRETPNPTEMSEDNIADSADLTRYANTIVCLWNSEFDNVKGGKSSYLQTEDGKKLEARGFNLGEGGKIYAKITKNRGGTPYIDTILDFIGETGCIPREISNPEDYRSTLLDDLPEDTLQTL